MRKAAGPRSGGPAAHQLLLQWMGVYAGLAACERCLPALMSDTTTIPAFTLFEQLELLQEDVERIRVQILSICDSIGKPDRKSVV